MESYAEMVEHCLTVIANIPDDTKRQKELRVLWDKHGPASRSLYGDTKASERVKRFCDELRKRYPDAALAAQRKDTP